MLDDCGSIRGVKVRAIMDIFGIWTFHLFLYTFSSLLSVALW